MNDSTTVASKPAKEHRQTFEGLAGGVGALRGAGSRRRVLAELDSRSTVTGALWDGSSFILKIRRLAVRVWERLPTTPSPASFESSMKAGEVRGVQALQPTTYACGAPLRAP